MIHVHLLVLQCNQMRTNWIILKLYSVRRNN